MYLNDQEYEAEVLASSSIAQEKPVIDVQEANEYSNYKSVFNQKQTFVDDF